MARVPQVVRAVRGVVHRGIDAHRQSELCSLRVERVVAAIAGGDLFVHRVDHQPVQAVLADDSLELANGTHPIEGADANEAHEEVGPGVDRPDRRRVRHGHERLHDARFLRLLAELLESHGRAPVLG